MRKFTKGPNDLTSSNNDPDGYKGESQAMPFSEAVVVNPRIRLERGETYPFVSMAAVDPNSQWAYADEQREYSTGGARFEDGDTLMARITPCLENGKVARYRSTSDSKAAYGSTEFIIIRGRPEVTDNRFAYYLTQSPTVRDYAISQMTGTSGRQRVPTSALGHIDVSIPPIEEQYRIAHILGTLDDKIDLNRRMNATLEGMARALFKSWFVDFEPVRAKMEGRWRRGESLPGMSADMYDLFPKRLVPSELGEVPEGWEIRTMGDISDVVGGSTPRTSEVSYWENGTNFFATPKDLSFLSVPVLLKSERQITDAGVARISSGSLPVGTVLLSSRAPIGYLAITEIPVSVNQGFIAMKPKPDISNLFLLYLTRSLHDEIVSRANGTTYLEISKRNFRPIPVVTPPPTTMSAFHRMAKQLYDRIVMNEKEKSTLFGLRECLLPKLVSGQIPLSQDTDLIATR